MRARIGLIARLSYLDCREEWPSALCMILSITAVLVPILLLLSIRSGVIGQMRGELSESPQARELITIGEPDVSAALVSQFRRDPSVAFVAPKTRLLSASAVLRSFDLSRGIELDMVASGPGDPMIKESWHGDSIGLSESAARSLRLKARDRVVLIFDRRTPAGADQQIRLTLQVLAVVDYRTARSNLAQAYLPYQLVEAAERWRENPEILDIQQAYAANAADSGRRRYSGMRIYARSIEAVVTLRQNLQSHGIDTESRAADIRLIQRLERSMNIFIGSLAALMALGLIVALGAIQWGWVERKRFDYSYLRLLGMKRGDLFALPILQAIMLAVPAGALAAGIAGLAQLVINRLFAGQLGSLKAVSKLSLSDVVLLILVTFLVAACGAYFAARSAARMSPITALRGS